MDAVRMILKEHLPNNGLDSNLCGGRDLWAGHEKCFFFCSWQQLIHPEARQRLHKTAAPDEESGVAEILPLRKSSCCEHASSRPFPLNTAGHFQKRRDNLSEILPSALCELRVCLCARVDLNFATKGLFLGQPFWRHSFFLFLAALKNYLVNFGANS